MAASISMANTKKSKTMTEKTEFLFRGLNGSSISKNVPIHCPQPIRRKIIEEITIQDDEEASLDGLCDSPPPRPKNPWICPMVSPSSLMGPGSLCESWLVESNKACVPKIPLAAASVSAGTDVTSSEVNNPKFRVAGFDVKGNDK